MKKNSYLKKHKYLVCILVAAGLSAIAFACYGLFWNKATYDARYIAARETEMWKAYYSKDKTKLAWNLVQFLSYQFGISRYEAGEIARLLAESAMKFKGAKDGHYDVALPSLIEAYAKIRVYSGLKFDPEKVARADLAWWIDRRNPKRNSPEMVGRGITNLCELLYGYSHPGFDRAGFLRAQAAYIRYQGGENCDWEKVEELLVEAYSALKEGIDRTN